MKPRVFFADLTTSFNKNLMDKVTLLLDRVNLRAKIREKDLVAIKLHFGEKGNTAFVPSYFLRRIVDQVKQCQGKPFLTDTNTLYIGSRSEAASHISTAYKHGFSYSVVDAPVIIADGLRGNSAVKVAIDKPTFKTVSIAHDIFMADALLCVTHFKGHELSGIGGTLKNLGMGCSSREGKLSQHSNLSPKVKKKDCIGCKRCQSWCPAKALSMKPLPPEAGRKEETSYIDPSKCIGCGECILTCPVGAIQIRWDDNTALFQKKMVEYAYGAIQNKEGKTLYLNFLTQITPACDCNPFSEIPVVNDIGILASEDPVAIDQASADLVNEAEGNRSSKLQKNWKPGEDKFRGIYPEIDWSVQLSYAEQLGMGSREYEMVKL